MSQIVPFVFNHDQHETPIRVVAIGGEPWFVGADCSGALGLTNSREALRRLKSEERGVISIDTLGGPQRMAIINQRGLTRLVLRSDKPQAQAFQDWIVEEVVPSILRTGRYVIPAAAPEPDLLAALQIVVTDIKEIKGDIADIKVKVNGGRENFSNATVRYVAEGMAKHNNCECIYCNETVVVTQYGEKLANCHEHHANGNRADTSTENCTLPCLECHHRLTNKKRPDHIPAHRALGIADTFHLRLKQKAGQIKPPNPTATKHWDFRPAIQTDLALNWPHAHKRRQAQ